jgi:AraC-like DNA-binding protein
MLQSVGTFSFPAGRLVLPDVCCDVAVVNGRMYFTGAMTRARPAIHTDCAVQLLRIGIASTRDWLRVPLADLTDLVVPLEDIDRRLSFEVERFLDYGGTQNERIAKMRTPPPDVRFMNAAKTLADGGPVQSAAARVALSERHLERMFRDRVGMTPKLFARIVRFRKAFFAAHAGAPFASAAIDGGYADQAHFTREVQALTGCSPTSLLRRTGDVGFVQDPNAWRDVGCE